MLYFLLRFLSVWIRNIWKYLNIPFIGLNNDLIDANSTSWIKCMLKWATSFWIASLPFRTNNTVIQWKTDTRLYFLRLMSVSQNLYRMTHFSLSRLHPIFSRRYFMETHQLRNRVFFIFYCFYGQNCTPITIYKSQCLYDNMDFNTDFHFRLNWLSIYNQVSVGPKHLISALLSVHDDRIQGETKTLGEIVLVKALFDGKWGFPFRIM